MLRDSNVEASYFLLGINIIPWNFVVFVNSFGTGNWAKVGVTFYKSWKEQ